MKCIIFGSTGMVGEGALHVALHHPDVTKVLVVNRRPCGTRHPKLTEVLHSDFLDVSPVRSSLAGYDACFFCMGISSIRKSEEQYTATTYRLTMHIATVLAELNPATVFCYVSGLGTDSTEHGRSMWARVKGRTENELLKLFPSAFMFRPGYIQPIPGMKSTYRAYRFVAPLYPIWRLLFPRSVCTLEEIGLAMIHAGTRGSDKRVLECPDIRSLADPRSAGHEKGRA